MLVSGRAAATGISVLLDRLLPAVAAAIEGNAITYVDTDGTLRGRVPGLDLLNVAEEILDTRNLRKLQDWVYANCRTVPAAAAVPPAIIALAEMIDAHQSLRLVDGPARAPPPFSTPPPMTTAPEGWIPVVAA